jgi:hypothetical protein
MRQVICVTDYWVEYTGSITGLTKGKWYQILDRGNFSFSDEHYYFLDDNDKLVGIYSRDRFKNVTIQKKRLDRLNSLSL